MNVDCQWIEENLEALFCDRLTPERGGLARLHMESCHKCREKVDELIAIDPLIKHVFRHDLTLARAPKQRRSPILIGAFGTGLAAVVLLLAVRIQPWISTPAIAPPPPIVASIPVPEPPPIPKNQDATTAPDRAKPAADSPDQPSPTVRPLAPAVGEKAPEFLVTDLAGYSRTLNDYRGSVLIFGVWSSAQPKTVANLERIYKSFGGNTKLRVLGVSDKGEKKPVNATFPMANNQGSTLMGATSGQFFIVDTTGTVRLRGNLLDNPSRILTSIRNALDPLGIHIR